MIRSATMLFLMTALLTACVNSVPKLERQEIVSNLSLPPWTASSDAFHMHEEGTLEMTGSLLIWDDTIAIDDLVQISQLSAAKRSQVVSFEREGLWLRNARTELDAKEQQRQEQQTKLLNLLTAAYTTAKDANPDAWQKLMAKRRDIAVNLIAAEFDALATLDTDWDRTASENLLNTYCDGKIFEYAVNPELLQRSYKTQPTPHIVCENYYRQLMPACPETAGQETGSRIQCVWQTLMATPTFAKYYPESDTLTALKTFIAEKPAEFADLILATHQDSSKGRYLRFYQRFGRIGFGASSITVKPQKGMLKVIRLVEAIESKHQLDSPATLPTDQLLFPSPAATPEITAQRQRIVAIMQLLAQRLHNTSISDYWFNEPTPPFTYIDLLACDNDDQSNLSAANRSSYACALQRLFDLVEGLRDELTPSEEQLETIKALRTTAAKLVQDIKTWAETIAKREIEALTLYSEAVNATANAVSADGIARALYSQAQLAINKSKELLQVSILLTETVDVRYAACFDRLNAESVACTDLPEGVIQDTSIFSIYYDEIEGRLDMHFNLADPTLFGLQSLSRGGLDRTADRASFCNISADEFRGLTLDAQLYANLYDEALEILNGSAVFRDPDGNTVYTASLGFDRAVNF
ncbi:MAG: hypothetical protein OYH77_07705 [Pseudomonadota bacterium]|nr:hypothetical protein [Pseudomonadota bacterium]